MALTGLTGLYGQRTAGYTGAARPEAYGTTADPRHGQYGDAAGPAWAAPGWNAALDREAQDAYTGGWVLTDDTDYEGLDMGSAAGQLDQTPYPATVVTGYAGRGQHRGYEAAGSAPAEGPENHAGPYPRTWLQAGRLRPEPGTELDDQWTEQEARRITHEGGYGADRPGPTGPDEPEFSRRDVYYQTQGSTLLQAPGNQLRYAPGAGSGPAMGQSRQTGSNNDQVQGGGQPNDYGYGDAHVQNYRQQTDGVPFNFNWLDASERPFIPKGQLTNMYMAQTLDGADSPYGAAGDQTDYSEQTFAPAMVEGPATPYQAPPDPTMGTAYPDDGEDEWAWG